MKKLILVVVVIIIAVGGWFAYQQYTRQKATQAISDLQSVSATEGDLTATVGATGIVRSNQSALLTWLTSGSVDEVDAAVGDYVEANQVLATLEKTSLPQNVIMAQADLVNAHKELDDLYSNSKTAKTEAMKAISSFTKSERDAQYQLDNYTVPSNQADFDIMEALNVMEERLNEARQAFEPYRYLSSSNQTRQKLKDVLEEAQSNYNSAVKRLEYEYEVEVAKDNLAKAKEDYETWKDGPDPSDITAAEARVAAAEATLKQAWIEAPFDGTITNVKPQPGDQIAPNTEAFRLDDLSRLLMDVQVSEVDINRIRVGQDVKISFDAILDKEYHGAVIEVDPVGTSNQGVVDFTVTVELIDADEGVKPGMTAAVNIVVEKLVDVLLVPNRAVRFVDGQRVVYILVDNQPSPVTITLGVSSETMSEVLEGELQVGDQIVLNPPQEFDRNGPPPFMR